MGYKGAVMRSINRPTAAKVGRPPRQRQRKQTSSSSSSTASSDSGTSSSPGAGAAGAGSAAAAAASVEASGGGGGGGDGLAPRKKLYISYNDIDVPAKIALTKISRRTKVLVYGKSGDTAAVRFPVRLVRGDSFDPGPWPFSSSCLRKCLKYSQFPQRSG